MPPRPRFPILPIAEIAPTLPGHGRIGFAPCPGFGVGGLDADLDTIRRWGAASLLTLVEDEELAHLDVVDLGLRARALGLLWYHLPIVDMGTPDLAFERAWLEMAPGLRGQLAAGRGVLVHCRGGFGRSGMIAARLLVELGTGREDAILQARAARAGAIETSAQEAYVRALGGAIRPDAKQAHPHPFKSPR
jgi:ADP-ribosyl-[dinitrogen reductase] hydrolase